LLLSVVLVSVVVLLVDLSSVSEILFAYSMTPDPSLLDRCNLLSGVSLSILRLKASCFVSDFVFVSELLVVSVFVVVVESCVVLVSVLLVISFFVFVLFCVFIL